MIDEKKKKEIAVKVRAVVWYQIQQFHRDQDEPFESEFAECLNRITAWILWHNIGGFLTSDITKYILDEVVTDRWMRLTKELVKSNHLYAEIYKKSLEELSNS